MTHLKTLGIKFIIISIITYSTFGIFFNASLINLFWISVLVTAVSYLIGDLLVLPRFGNIVASIADFPLAFLSFWILGNVLLETGMSITAITLLAAFLMSLCEPLIHAYMEEQLLHVNHKSLRNESNVQTEFSEETDPNPKDKR